MSVYGLNSSSAAIYANVLKAINQSSASGDTSGSTDRTGNDYAARLLAALSSQTGQSGSTDGSASSGSASAADMLSKLSSLIGPQPTLLDFMNDDSASSGSGTDDLSGLEGLSPEDGLLGALSSDGSSSATNDPLLSLSGLGASGVSTGALTAIAKYAGSSAGGSSALLNMLEQAYGQSSPTGSDQDPTSLLINSLT